MTDDIGMEALSGTVPERGAAALKAGCDLVLHCNGDAAEQVAMAKVLSPMTPAATTRANHALSQRKPPVPIDIAACSAELDALLR